MTIPQPSDPQRHSDFDPDAHVVVNDGEVEIHSPDVEPADTFPDPIPESDKGESDLDRKLDTLNDKLGSYELAYAELGMPVPETPDVTNPLPGEKAALVERLMEEARQAADLSEPAAQAETSVAAPQLTGREAAKEITRPTFIASATKKYNEIYAQLRAAYRMKDIREYRILRTEIAEPISRLADLGVVPDDPDGLLRD
jgi:hypothetical protein